MMRSFSRELIVPSGMIVIAAIYIANTTDVSSLAKVFPYSILALLVLFSVLEAWKQYRTRTNTEASSKPEAGPVAKIAIASVLFVAASYWFGLIAAAAVFMAVSSMLLGAALRPALAVSAATTAVFYAVFVLGLGLRI